MEEVWKDIPRYEGMYQVSNLGRVKSLDRIGLAGQKIYGRVLKACYDKNGYCLVNLYKGGKCKTFRVHRLVAEQFIENPRNYPMINHRDEMKTNNCTDNLEWCDAKYNANYGTKIQRQSQKLKGKPNIYAQGSSNYFYGKRYCGKDNYRARVVYCYSSDKQLIQIFDTIRAVSKFLGYTEEYIGKICNGKRKPLKTYILSYEPLEDV